MKTFHQFQEDTSTLRSQLQALEKEDEPAQRLAARRRAALERDGSDFQSRALEAKAASQQRHQEMSQSYSTQIELAQQRREAARQRAEQQRQEAEQRRKEKEQEAEQRRQDAQQQAEELQLEQIPLKKPNNSSDLFNRQRQSRIRARDTHAHQEIKSAALMQQRAKQARLRTILSREE